MTQLPVDEGKIFYKLHPALEFFANQRLTVIPDQLANARELLYLPPEVRLKVRDSIHDQPHVIDEFVRENPCAFTPEELEIVASWKHAVVGTFYIFRYLKKHTIFLKTESPHIAYGVLALADSFNEIVGPNLPVMCDAVLLPFKDKIIYDGMLSAHRISFGGGVKRNLNDSYRKAKDRLGIVTSLPIGSAPVTKRKAAKPKKRQAAKPSPDDVKSALEAIVELTDRFCQNNLNDEYLTLCQKLAEKLARKRPSPLLRGKPQTWACGIVRTIGWVNFLQDRSQSPCMKLTAIDEEFGVAQSTAQQKSSEIRKILKIAQLAPDWCLPSLIDSNPRVWMLEVNGFVLDVRYCPREIQEVAFENGLIPYIPVDRNKNA